MTQRRYMQWTLAALPLLVFAAAAAGAAGCEAVPDLRFVEEDARADSSRLDGGTNGGDGPAIDGAPVTCSAPSPGAGATCCGSAWCVGDCAGANCAACESTPCTGVEVCCGRPQGVICKRGACN